MSSPRASLAQGLVVLALIALGLAAVPGVARADGDPASDVLLAQQIFVPWDADASASEVARLQALVATAGRHGYPVRVAVIASASDLGSVTQLWRAPRTYAEYLGIELSLAFHGSVIVVMPSGDGVYHSGLAATVAAATLARIRTRARPGGLTVNASAAVQRLAAAAGHPLPASAPPVTATTASVRGASDIVAWVVVALGAALVALAWAASLRARPLGGRPAGH